MNGTVFGGLSLSAQANPRVSGAPTLGAAQATPTIARPAAACVHHAKSSRLYSRPIWNQPRRELLQTIIVDVAGSNRS